MQAREQFVRERINEHNEAYFAISVDAELPECTPEQMWEKPTSYAIIKEGGVRAKSVHPTLEEAQALLPPKGYAIHERKGERTRCAKYCQVSQFCTQYQQYLSENQ
jgi:hypothetical protein